MARKGTATVNKTANKQDKYISVDSDSGAISPISTASTASTASDATKAQEHARESEKVDPVPARALLIRSSQPSQASPTVEQSSTPAHALFPLDSDAGFLTAVGEPPILSVPKPPSHIYSRPARVSHTRIQRTTVQAPVADTAHADLADRTRQRHSPSANDVHRRQDPRPDHLASSQSLAHTRTMASSGAYIPPNQQRNMRACMVCSIVRTQQQFMSSGCPNCEDILELAGNPEQINDCTSQVFEGLISVADTKRSWVARYQRLEGYVPGVYATQVEGILPEDIIGAVESAGINYVPRDGSEQEMLPKD